jgi:hypothetical protein
MALQSLQIDSDLFTAMGLECLDIAGRQEYKENHRTQCKVNIISTKLLVTVHAVTCNLLSHTSKPDINR